MTMPDNRGVGRQLPPLGPQFPDATFRRGTTGGITDYLHGNAKVNTPFKTGTGQKFQTVSVGPPANQWWALKMARISITPATTVDDAGNIPPCQLFLTSQEVLTQDRYLDGTTLGNGDVTGTVSGLILYPGDQITARWGSGLADFTNAAALNPTGFLELIGTSSIIPPIGGFMTPDTLGPHFAGKQNEWQANTYSNTSYPFASTNPAQGNFRNLATVQIPCALQSMEWAWGGNSIGTGPSGQFVLRNGSTIIAELATDTYNLNGGRYIDFHTFIPDVRSIPTVKTLSLDLQQFIGETTAAGTIATTGVLMATNLPIFLP